MARQLLSIRATFEKNRRHVDGSLLHRNVPFSVYCSAISLQHHQKRSRADQNTADPGFNGELLMQEDEGQHQRDHDAELVDRDHLRRFSQLQRLVVNVFLTGAPAVIPRSPR